MRLLLLSLTASLTLVPSQASSQRRLAGVVTDSTTGTVVEGASARLRAAAVEVETDAAGRFDLPSPSTPADTLVVHRIGFVDGVREITPADDTLRVRLRPDPVMIAALRAVGSSTALRRCLDCDSFPLAYVKQGIRGFDVVQLLEDRVGYRRVPCARSADRQPVYCSVIRGNPEPIRAFVDGKPATGGLDDLSRYPLASIYSIDVSRNRRVVSLTTNRAIEAAAWEHLHHSGALP
jgi:hypothetical protein